MIANDKILLVDDEPNVLSGYGRVLRGRYDISLAVGGEEALKLLQSDKRFAAVVADMSMPGMNGVQLLAQVKRLSPNTVRMMLTGCADLGTAIDAVNEGNIFRFLSKPCPPEALARALDAAIEQYHLVIAEHELLSRTLSGSTKILVDLLQMANPAAFTRTGRLRRYVRHMAAELQLDNAWQYDIAAMLAQIGCVTLPADVVEKGYTRASLTPDEKRVFDSHPAIAARLLANIPRLEVVASMIEYQMLSCRDHAMRPGRRDARSATVTLGAQMLRVAIDYDCALQSGLMHPQAVRALASLPSEYEPRLLKALETLPPAAAQKRMQELRISELAEGLMIEQEVRSTTGLVLLPCNQEITLAILERLRNYAAIVGVVEPILVSIPGIYSRDRG